MKYFIALIMLVVMAGCPSEVKPTLDIVPADTVVVLPTDTFVDVDIDTTVVFMPE